MSTKYNNRFPMDASRTERHGSYIQAYLGDEINALLAPSANQISQVSFNELYIHNEEMEYILGKYTQHTNSNNTCIIEGLTGAGKTMLIRHVFDIHTWKVHISNNSIIIPFSFDNALYDSVKSIFSGMMHGACDCLIKNYPELKDIDHYSDDFYTYIEEHRQDLHYFKDQYPTPSKAEQLKLLHDKNALAFYSSALKFYLGQADACAIDNVVLVVDDIEGIRVEGAEANKEQLEMLPIKMVLELIECMQNKGEQSVSWSLNTVICCRHYVSRMMKTLPYSLENNSSYINKFQAYGPCDRFDLQESPSIMDIINKRYKALLAKEKNIASEKWTTAMQVVMQLLEEIDNNVTDFILDLTLDNKREAMKWVKQLVLNKRWIQKDFKPEHPGAFNISDLAQYRVTPPALIQAIGMNESAVYHSQESIIPNLLNNDPNGETDLFTLLTLKRFLVLAEYESMSWDASFQISHFLESVNRLFNSKDYAKKFKDSVHYLILHRLFLRSYDQEQTDNIGLTRNNIDTVESIYVSKLAVNMWKRLSSSSVLFEMFIDDVWLSNDIRSNLHKPNSLLFSRVLTDNFEVCLNYLSKLIEIERKVFVDAVIKHHQISDYEEVFGIKAVCSHLVSGLEKSLYAYYKPYLMMSPSGSEIVDRWWKTIKDFKEACKKIHSTDIIV